MSIGLQIEEITKKQNEDENRKRFEFEKNKLYAYLEDLTDGLKKYKAYIAGGAITSLFTGAEINDIDIYFRNEKSLIDFLEYYWQNETYVTCLTKKSILMIKGQKLKLQLVHFKYFKSPEEIFDTFDFTVCMGVFDFASEQFILHRDFLKHNSQRILKFNKNTAFPLVSLLRVQKYNKKGYTISKPEFIRIILKCMTLEVDTVEKLKDHLGGMYGINYDKIIEFVEGEKFSLDSVIDKIANISLSEDYFKQPSELKFEDLDDIIDTVKKRTIHVLKIKNNLYRIGHNGRMKPTKAKTPFFVEVDPKEFFKNKRFYKWVIKKGDGVYCSHYRNSFIYEIGKQVTTENHYLYFNEAHEINCSSYFNTGVLIEVSIDPEDFVKKSGGNVNAKKCTVIREVPRSEWECWINDQSDDDWDEDNDIW